jgi:catechol 2,3-dioxygenase-like lactoylglutathione lyase family enzyme
MDDAMTLFKQFTHVSVTVTDVGKAREFYSDILGFQEIPRQAIEALGLLCRDVVSGPTGLRQVFVKDPDGNMVEFIGPSKRAGARVMESPGTHR